MADRGNRGGRPQRGERADRLINAGHSRGLDASLAKAEASIRNLKTERVVAFDKNGKEIARSSKGSKSGTRLPDGYNYENSIVTHNHPNKGLGDTIAGRVGTVLSGADIYTSVANNVAEMRNVTKTYTYSLKRPKNGWGISEQEAYRVFGKKDSEWKRKFNTGGDTYFAKSGIESRVRAKTDELLSKRSEITRDGRIPTKSEYDSYTAEANSLRKRTREANDRYNVGIQYQVLKEYAKKYGWELTRKKTV